MFRFFSRLRAGALKEAAITRYLGYAIGEIALVVVGILIALQINGWAEDRAERRFELASLEQIHKNLETDYAVLAEILAGRKRSVESVNHILRLAGNPEPHEDLPRWLADVIQFDRFHAITNAYATLRSRGLDIVTNEEPRRMLGVYYDDLSVLMLNCTLTRSPNLSHTEGLLKVAERIFQANGVRSEVLRPVDYEIPAGLAHIGYTVPPQADAGWMGEAGPGPSYMDKGSGGPENDFTNRNTTFLVCNCLHLARMLKDAGGIPAHGKQPDAWAAGCRTDLQSPEHRR